MVIWIWLKIIDTPNRWFPTKYNHSCGSFGTLILSHCHIPNCTTLCSAETRTPRQGAGPLRDAWRFMEFFVFFAVGIQYILVGGDWNMTGLCFHLLKISSSQLTFIFLEWDETTNQFFLLWEFNTTRCSLMFSSFSLHDLPTMLRIYFRLVVIFLFTGVCFVVLTALPFWHRQHVQTLHSTAGVRSGGGITSQKETNT